MIKKELSHASTCKSQKTLCLNLLFCPGCENHSAFQGSKDRLTGCLGVVLKFSNVYLVDIFFTKYNNFYSKRKGGHDLESQLLYLYYC